MWIHDSGRVIRLSVVCDAYTVFVWPRCMLWVLFCVEAGLCEAETGCPYSTPLSHDMLHIKLILLLLLCDDFQCGS